MTTAKTDPSIAPARDAVGIVSSGGFGDFNVHNSTKCHLDGRVFSRRVDAALYMCQKLGFKLIDAAQYVRELPERDSSPNTKAEGAAAAPAEKESS